MPSLLSQAFPLSNKSARGSFSVLICLSWGFLYPAPPPCHPGGGGVAGELLRQDAQLDGGKMEDSESIWAHLHPLVQPAQRDSGRERPIRDALHQRLL